MDKFWASPLIRIITKKIFFFFLSKYVSISKFTVNATNATVYAITIFLSNFLTASNTVYNTMPAQIVLHNHCKYTSTNHKYHISM